MDVALRHALDRDSHYFELLLEIFSRLPAEDIARCRTLSRSARRLLYNDRFLSHLPLEFSGFIWHTSEYVHYFSIPSGRTFTISRCLEDLRIASTHHNLLLATGTAYGIPWRIVNPLTGKAVRPPSGPYLYEYVISAAICWGTGSDYTVFFLVSSHHEGTWMVTLSKTTTAFGTYILQRLRQLSGNLLISIREVQLRREIRPGVHARFASNCFFCVLFPESKQVLVVSCSSQDYWVFQLYDGEETESGEYGLCRNAAGEVHLTWISVEYVAWWRLELTLDLEPHFKDLPELHIEHFSHFPRLRIEHIEDEYVYLRYGPYGKYIQPYNIETSSIEDVIELPLSMGNEDGMWPHLFAYSCYLRIGRDRWQD